MASRATDEQRRIVAAAAGGGHVKAQAFAGTGKTTTLRMVASSQQARRRRGLYIAFNRSVQAEAARRFAGLDVDARTAHSVAFGAMRMAELQDRLATKIWPGDLVRELDLGRAGRLSAPMLADLALKTVERFCCGADEAISEAHLAAPPERLGPEAADVLAVAGAIWERMCDRGHPTFPIFHDAYLKQWQIAGGALPAVDYVLYDEAQDASGAMTAALRRGGVQTVWAGDEHQEVYRFRGAVNAMRDVPGTPLPLATSFRFGPVLADVANRLLRVKPERLRPRWPLAGNPEVATRVARVPDRGYALVTRTNLGWFNHAVQVERPFCMAGGRADFEARMALVRSAYWLWRGRRPERGDIARFERWGDLVEHVDITGDLELAFVRKLVEANGEHLPGLLDRLESRCVDDIRQADYVVTTTHRAKGLEWRAVKLADDFVPCDDEGMLKRGFSEREEEINLLYVAATRARLVVEPNAALRAAVAAVGRGDDLDTLAKRRARPPQASAAAPRPAARPPVATGLSGPCPHCGVRAKVRTAPNGNVHCSKCGRVRDRRA